MRRFHRPRLTDVGLLAFLVLLIAVPLSRAHASYPAPVITVAEVCSFLHADGSKETKFFGQITGPSPEDVASFTVTGPSGVFNLAPHRSSRQKGLIYRHKEDSILRDGSYTFEVTDSLGRPASVVRDFTYNSTLPQVDSGTMSPQNEAYVGSTTPTLSFDPLDGGGVYYQVQVRDWFNKAIWYSSPRTQDTSFTIPEGLLQPDTPYIWFVRVWDSDTDPQNYCESERLSFYAGTRGLPDLSKRYVSSRPSGEDCGYRFKVRETNVAQWDIDSLTVTGPDSTVYNLDSVDCRFYCPAYYFAKGTAPCPPIPDGDYTFYIEDDEENTDTQTLSYTYNPVPAVSEGSRNPADNAYLDTNRPTFSWAPVTENGTYYYRLRIRDYTRQKMKWYDSPWSTETSVTVPEGVLLWGSSYKWQVIVADSDGDSTPINNMNFASTRTFTINPYVDVCEGDFDGDGDVDGSDLATFAAGGASITLEEFAEDFGRMSCP